MIFSTDQTALCCDALTVKFDGSDMSVLHGVSLSVQPNKIHALIGRSGAGKSTILNAISGFVAASSGDISLGGRQLVRSGTALVKPSQRRISYVFQKPTLFPHLSLAENICFGVKKTPQKEKVDIAENWLERLGLAGRSKDYPHHLSGGEAQRVALARALAANPNAILLDEPFSNLNAALRRDIQNQTFEIIKSMGIPCLWVTHSPSEAMQYADEVSVLCKGRLLQTANPLELYRHPVKLEVINAVSSVFTVQAHLWPPNMLGFTPSRSSGVVALRRDNFYLDKTGDAFTIDDKTFLGHHILLKVSHDILSFEVHLPSMHWDALSVGQKINLSCHPYGIYEFD